MDGSTVDIAKKQRHLNLLKKVQAQQSLSARELKELEAFEKRQDGHGRIRTDTSRAAKKNGGRKSALTAAAVKGWGMGYETMADCERDERLGFELREALAAQKNLDAAWQRGQLLRRLADFGAGNASIAEVEHELGFAPGGLERVFAADDEAAQAFNNARLRTIIKLRTAIVERVEKGDVTPTTMRQVEAMLRKEVARKSIDYHHIPLQDLVELVGVSRQTIHKWTVEFGLSKNADESYDLYKFIPWHEQFVKAKITKEPGKYFDKSDDLDRVRAEKIRLQLRRESGDLLDRSMVLSGQLARLNQMVEFMNRNASDLPMQIEHCHAEKIVGVLEEFFEKLRKQMCVVPEELMLPEAAAEKFRDTLETLANGKNVECQV